MRQLRRKTKVWFIGKEASCHIHGRLSVCLITGGIQAWTVVEPENKKDPIQDNGSDHPLTIVSE